MRLDTYLSKRRQRPPRRDFGVPEGVDLRRGLNGEHKKEKVLLVLPVELLAEMRDKAVVEVITTKVRPLPYVLTEWGITCIMELAP